MKMLNVLQVETKPGKQPDKDEGLDFYERLHP